MNYPVTPAIRFLREQKIPFTPHLYPYEEHGGTRASAVALLVDEHEVIKTLVMQTEEKRPLLVLMHGYREVSTKQLARLVGVKRIEPYDAATAHRHTGYPFSGTSPFVPAPLPIYAEESIAALAPLHQRRQARLLGGTHPGRPLQGLSHHPSPCGCRCLAQTTSPLFLPLPARNRNCCPLKINLVNEFGIGYLHIVRWREKF